MAFFLHPVDKWVAVTHHAYMATWIFHCKCPLLQSVINIRLHAYPFVNVFNVGPSWIPQSLSQQRPHYGTDMRAKSFEPALEMTKLRITVMSIVIGSRVCLLKQPPNDFTNQSKHYHLWLLSNGFSRKRLLSRLWFLEDQSQLVMVAWPTPLESHLPVFWSTNYLAHGPLDFNIYWMILLGKINSTFPTWPWLQRLVMLAPP